MVGQTIEARPPFPAGTLVWCGMGAVFVALAIASGQSHFLIACILPWTMAAVLWWRRPSPATLRIGKDELTSVGDSREIPYASIREVSVLGDPRRGPRAVGKPEALLIYHDHGQILLPPIMSVRPVELYGFLQARI